MRRVHGLVLLLVIVALGAGHYVVRYRLPDQHDPFAPLRIERPPGFATGFKMSRLRDDPRRCFAVLAASDLDYQRLPDQRTGRDCGLFDAARLLQSHVSYGGDIKLHCATLVALARWERHVLQPAARELLGQRVVRVRHYGTYSCRNINGKAHARRSEHATANAIDIAGFRLADGREIRIRDDWGEDSPAGRFLERVHDGACTSFRTVLGPDYNSLHHDHFHMGGGRYSVCR